MFYATAIACWMVIGGCFLIESDNNPYEDKAACEIETKRVYERVTTSPVVGYGLPDNVKAKCITKQELMKILGK